MFWNISATDSKLPVAHVVLPIGCWRLFIICTSFTFLLASQIPKQLDFDHLLGGQH